MKPTDLLAGIDRQMQQMTEWHVAVLAALVGVLGLSMPWVWADDHESPYRAYGLMVHWITATDKWYLARTALLDSVVATAGAGGIIGATLYSAAKIFITRRVGFDTTLRSVLILVMFAAILFLCNNLLDPDRPQIGSAAVPGIGLILVALSAAVLSVMGMRGAHKEAKLQERMARMVENNQPPPAPAPVAPAPASPAPTSPAPTSTEPTGEPVAAPAMEHNAAPSPHREPEQGSSRGYGPSRWFDPEPEADPVKEPESEQTHQPQSNHRPDPDSVYLPRRGRRRTNLRERNYNRGH